MWTEIVVVVGAVGVTGLLAHAAWVIHYAVTRAPLDQRLQDYARRSTPDR